MSVSDPPLYADVGGNASHAHPSPNEPVAPTDNLQRLRELVDGFTFNITLRGLAAQDNAPAPAMHFPRVRRAPFSQHSISHLDVISCWKGLSHSQAVEVTIWERLFRQCLATQIEEHLQGVVTNRLSESQDPVDEFSLLSRLVDCLKEDHRHLVDIDVIRLIREMIETFYEDHASEAAFRYFAWSLGSRTLPSFVYNFLRTQDCFLHRPTGPCLLVDFSSHSYAGPVLTVVADLTWLSPEINICNVPEELLPGEKYSISPRHVDASIEYGSANGYSISDDMHYTISQSALDLKYDPNEGCFHGTVPCLEISDGESSLVETTLSAHLVTPFPHGVRFELTTRYSIKLDVIQPKHPNVTVAIHCQMESSPLATEGPWVPSYTSTPLSKTRQTGLVREKDRVFAHVDSPLWYADETDEEVQEAFLEPVPPIVLQDTLSPTPNKHAQSPTKRKASQQKIPSLDMTEYCSPDNVQDKNLQVDIKRRKLGKGEYPNAEMDASASDGPNKFTINQPNLHANSVFHNTADASVVSVITDLMNKAGNFPLQYFAQREDLETYEAYKQRKRLAAKGKAKAEPTLFNWTLPDTASAGSVPSPEDTDSDTSTVPYVSPPNTATDSSHSKQSTELSQEQIQHNYSEFEERAKRRAAEKAYYATNIPNFDGIVSPTHSIDRDFERVFFEDSEVEDWASEIDGLSDGVESVNMEEM